MKGKIDLVQEDDPIDIKIIKKSLWFNIK
jgi:hypothetical protein